jgi:hypothetical protein
MKTAVFLWMISAWAAATASTNDAAIVSALCGGGSVLVTDYGFAISTPGRQTRAVRQPGGGYWVSGPALNVKLIPRPDGYAISPVGPLPDGSTVHPATVGDLFDAYYAKKKRPPKRR